MNAMLFIAVACFSSLKVAACSASPAPNMAKSVLLTDAVSTGARCLDGSPQRFWLQDSTSSANSSKFYFHFMGGGWCESMESCTARAYSVSGCYRGSSNITCFNANGDFDGRKFSEEMDFRDIPCINGARWGGGLLMNDPAINPLTHDWNKVEIQYCDGGSYSGNNETVSSVSYGGKDNLPLYFRGRKNFNAVLDWMVSNKKMDDATEIVISGDSAGGLATYWHLDAFKERFPKAHVVGAPDSGFFLGDASKPSWPQSLQWITEQMNSTSGLDASCVAAAKAKGKLPSTFCTLPEDVSPYISSPMFVMNSRFDSALISICSSGMDTDAKINALGAEVVRKVNETVLQKPNNAAFITACHEHCGQWGTGQKLAYNKRDFDDFNVTIDGMNALQAIDAWYHSLLGDGEQQTTTVDSSVAGPKRLWMQATSYPCKTCCSGGQK
jgi:hypothetical protein